MPPEHPLDIHKFKDLVRQESSRLNLRSIEAQGEAVFTLALALSAAVKKVFFEKSETTFSREPILERKLVTPFAHRMRVDAMEKFNASTIFSVVEFASNDESLERGQYLMTLVVYLENDFLPEFLRLLQYPYIDAEEESEIKDGCGTLANLIAGQYKKELGHMGYKDLMMSPFETYINTAPNGIGIPRDAMDKYELTFEVDGQNRLVVEMVTRGLVARMGAEKETGRPKVSRRRQ